MIKNILEMLKAQEHFGTSELIEIAKGKYKKTNTLKEVIKQIKRKWQIRKRLLK